MIRNFNTIDGMQNFVQPLAASVSEPELIINYIGTKIKGKAARTGYELWLDAPDADPVIALVGIYIKDATNGDGAYILRFSGKKIYKFEIGSGATSWGAAVHTFTNQPSSVMLEKYRNAVFIATGTNPLYYTKHDGSGNLVFTQETATEVPTNPSVLAVYSNALYANDSTVPYRLRRSSIGYGTSPSIGSPVVPFDGNQWVQDDNNPATARSYDVNPNTNGVISAIKVVNNRLAIWMASEVGDMGMHKFDMAASSLLQIPTSVSIRPNGQNTITVGEDGACYFANNDGVYDYDGSKPKKISLALGYLAEGISPSVAVDYKQRYMVALSQPIVWRDYNQDSITINHPVLVKDQVSDEWVIFDLGHQMTCFAKIALSEDDPVLLYSGDEDGNTYIWRDTCNDDAGRTIFGRIQWRPFFGTTIAKEMSLRELYAVSDPTGGQVMQIRPFELRTWGREQLLDKELSKLQLENASHTHGFAALLTTKSNGTRPQFYGFTAVYGIEEPDDGG